MFKGILYMFKICWKVEKKYIISLLAAEIFNALTIVCGIILPKYIIDELFVTHRKNYAIVFIALFLGITLVCNLLVSYCKYIAEKKRDSFYTKFSILHGKQLLETDYKNLEMSSFQDLRDNAMKYMNSNGFAGIIPSTTILLGRLFVVFGTILIILTLNIYILLIYLALIAIGTYVNAVSKKANIKLNLEMTQAERKANYIKTISVDTKYSKEIRLNNLSRWIIKKYSKDLDILNKYKSMRNKNDNKVMCVNTVTNFLQQAISYCYLIVKVFTQGISMGSFAMYLNAINSFHSTINDIVNAVVDLNQYTIYFKPFKEFMELPKTLREGHNLSLTSLESERYEIEFVNVSFKYPTSEKYALKNVSTTIIPGTKISIVGENGAGKSTFVKLLVRLYDPTEGRILLNGVDIRDINYDEYMKLFSVVFQDYKLFALSIKENICLDDTQYGSDVRILEAAEAAGVFQKILSLDRGLETSIYKMFDKDGIEPSGGEGQKIALARAVYRNSPIVILDEPTAALDPQSEYDIYQNFHKLVTDKTTVYISHRLASSKICDKILVFKDGQIVQEGHHDELISYKGLYSELFEMQAMHYKADERSEFSV